MENPQDMLYAAFDNSGNTQKQAAKLVGWVPQQLSQRLVRGSLRADEFLKLLDAVGVDLVMINRKTGERITVHNKGHGPRVVEMADRVMYDTTQADAISSSFFKDGKNEYTDGKAEELYIDSEGRLFFAEYTKSEDGTVNGRIRPTTANAAEAFIKSFGSTGNTELPYEEREIAGLYRKASDRDKQIVRAVLDSYKTETED